MASAAGSTGGRALLMHLIQKPFSKYNSLLETSPIRTKCITSGLMYAAGDLLAQGGEYYTETRDEDPAKRRRFVVNWKRLGIFFIWGAIPAGLAYHYWFNYLDTLPLAMLQLRQHRQRLKLLRAFALLKRNGIKVDFDLDKLPLVSRNSKWVEKAAKIAADQLIFSSLYTLVFFLAVGTLNGGVDLVEADLRAAHIDEVQNVLSKYNKPERKLENELTRLKSRLSMRGASEPGHDDSIDKVLALLNEEKNKTSLTMQDVLHNTWSHTQDVYWQTYIADCIFWPPLQLINFTFVPLRFQVLYVNGCNLVWNTFLSFMANKKH